MVKKDNVKVVIVILVDMFRLISIQLLVKCELFIQLFEENKGKLISEKFVMSNCIIGLYIVFLLC